jgi:hypothetical protein
MSPPPGRARGRPPRCREGGLLVFPFETGSCKDFKGQRYHARVFHELPRDRRERRAWGMQCFIGRDVQ